MFFRYLQRAEKLKLYDAIGYTEGEDSLLKYPENVILIFVLTLQVRVLKKWGLEWLQAIIKS